MVRDDIELVDKKYFRIPLVKPSRKIKFKSISFKNILSRWNAFRLERLKRKLEDKKSDLVEMEFSAEQLKNQEKVEKKVLRKTQAIAKLESKINFLESGNYHSEEFVDSRAIKLKSLMMKNLEYNKDSLYSVNEKTAEEIMTGQTVSEIVDEETARIAARVREILAEKEAARKAAASAPVESEVTTTEAESIPVVSSDEVAAAIDNEMNKIKVSSNESAPAKVNKFINEDGTYRLRREDIDEDFRITHFDRSKLPVVEEQEIDIPPFSETVRPRKKVDVDDPRKALTEIKETKIHTFPEIILPTIREPIAATAENEPEEEDTRTVPVVVPERKSIKVKPVKKTIEHKAEEVTAGESTYGDLGALMARVNLLRSEKRTIESMTEETEKKATSVDEAHKEMMRRLSEYADSLEAECNASYEAMSQIKKEAAAKESQINAMIEIMGAAQEEQPAKGRTK